LEYRSDTIYERNNRNDRFRLAMPSVPTHIQDLVIKLLRQIPLISSPEEPFPEAIVANDLRDLQDISEQLIKHITAF